MPMFVWKESGGVWRGGSKQGKENKQVGVEVEGGEEE